MSYYLLIVEQAGPRAYKETAGDKHQVEAASLDEAKWHADDIIDNHYRKIDQAVMRLFDETGLVATRRGVADWDA